MSRILRVSGTVEDDVWLPLDDETAWPESGTVTVSLARWQSSPPPHGLLQVGVRVPNTEDIDQVSRYLIDRPLIELDIPKFTDGRAYSQARLLRERYRYAGEIRAVGDVLVDQLQPMARCGFDAFVLRADQSADTGARLLRDFSLAYQHAADRPPLVTVWERRRAAGIGI